MDYYLFRTYIFIFNGQYSIQQKKIFVRLMHSLNRDQHSSGRNDLTSYQNGGRRS